MSKRKVVSKKIQGSTAIRRVRYNPDTEVLTIEMQFGSQGHGSILRYGGVPKYIYDELVESSSKGGYFNENIRDVFTYLGES